MTLQRFNFQEFGEARAAKSAKQFLPSGRMREEAPPPPPPPTFTEEQLKNAERDGYKKGFLEGTEEGRKQAESEQASIDRKLTEIVEKFTSRLAPLFNDYRQKALQLKEEMPKMALAVARKVAGPALAENGAKVIEDIAVRACETLFSEPQISIAVPEAMADTLERKLLEIASRLQTATDIVILRDPEMPPADCRIEWHHGVMERNTEKLWQQLEQVIENITATALRDTETEMNALQKQLPPGGESNG